jgi:hypothetical protein
MTTNLTELRKEAYRLWGLGNHTVIYDYPQSPRCCKDGFHFKIDFSEDKASWPRAYAFAERPNQEPSIRVILPIFILKRYNTFQAEVGGWYDMPKRVHDQLLDITNEMKVHRKLPVWQRAWNRCVPIRYRFAGVVPVESYRYVASQHNGEVILRAL